MVNKKREVPTKHEDKQKFGRVSVIVSPGRIASGREEEKKKGCTSAKYVCIERAKWAYI
jgi:hypothetical protein